MPSDHPDAALVAELHRELDAWLALDQGSPTPTSSITGGGAIRFAEGALSALVEGRPAQLVPNATYGLYVALASVGVTAGTDVLIPAVDWTAGHAAVTALGARALPVAVDPIHLTIDPTAAAAATTPHTSALVACHLYGVPADVPALRQALPGVAIVEDCAQSLGSRLDSVPVGALGDMAVFSFGPGKTICAGEVAAIVSRDAALAAEALALSAHPARQQLGGLEPRWGGFAMRPDPVAAMRLAVALTRFDGDELVASHRALSTALAARGVMPAGSDERRSVANTRAHYLARHGRVGKTVRARRAGAIDIAQLVRGNFRAVDVRSVEPVPTLQSTGGR